MSSCRLHRTVFRVSALAAIVAALLSGGTSAIAAAKPAPLRPWDDKNLSPDQKADLVIKEMTLDEKIAMVHGMPKRLQPEATSLGGAGYSAGVPRLGIPDLQSTDGRSGVAHRGPHGRYTTALPSKLALAATWDLDLARDYGRLLGQECYQLGFQILLGGTTNIIRDSRCGRCFECEGEDPILVGKMLAAEIRATQEQGVIADINRYALDDQETGRGTHNVVIDRRTMRETDLLAFEIAIKESDVGTVMGAYNRLNGDHCCENSYLLHDVLKREWGFKGWVMSDWGGTHSSAKAALAGHDQEMPADKFFGEPLKQAVENGELPIARLDDMVHRILRTGFAHGVFKRHAQCAVDPFAGAEVARRVAEQSIVLLRNEGHQLPLDAGRVTSVAVIGSHAEVGVLSGGGSDQVDAAGGNPVEEAWSTADAPRRKVPAVWHRSSPLRAIQARAPAAKVQYDPGTDVAEAARLAARSAVAIVFVHQHACEGFDLADLALPENQDALVEAVTAANPHTIVVLENNAAVKMPWLEKTRAVLAAWYPGIRGAEALASILFGDVDPSAKLPVTFPKSESDLPEPKLSCPPPTDFATRYAEGLNVGYKWFDAEKKEPLFPFGFGLSYTTFAYKDLKTVAGKPLQVTFQVTNTGPRAGAEIAQVYASLPTVAGESPKRLVGWEKVRLSPAETKSVTVSIDSLRLSVFNAGKDCWDVLPGEYVIRVGGSSRDTPLATNLSFKDTP